MGDVQATNRRGLSSYFIYSEGKLMAQDDKVWWHAKGDQKFGPYSSPQLKALAAKGSIELTDLIWKEGLANWLPASSVKGLIPVAVPAAPPPLPAAARSSAPVCNAVKPLNQKTSVAAVPTNDRSTSIESDSMPTNPALWNPSALANWSILLTPLFGSYFVAENYKAIGQEKEAKGAMVWLYIGVAIMVSIFFVELFNLSSYFRKIMPAYFVYLMSWYFLSARKQQRCIVSEYGKDYERQPWMRVLAIDGAAMVAWQLLLRLV